MTDDLDLMQLASTGQKLARLDLVEYLAVHVVLAWPANGAPAIYCAYQDWAATPIARLFAKDQEIAELGALAEQSAAEVVKLATELASLKAQLAERESPPAEAPAQNQARMFAKQATALQAGETDALPDPIVCPDCDEGGWKSARALQMHRQRTHQGMVAAKRAPAQFVEALGWRCAAKGCAGAHARDMHDPAFCTLHAEKHTNGALP